MFYAVICSVSWPRPDLGHGKPHSATAAQDAAPNSAPPSGHASPASGAASVPRSTTTISQQREFAHTSQDAHAMINLTPEPSPAAGERPRSAAFPVNRTTRARPRKATPKRGMSMSPVRRIAKPSEISLSPLSPERGTPVKRQKLSHGRGKKLSASPMPVTRSARLQARKAGAGAEKAMRPSTRARTAKDLGPPGTQGAPAVKRQLRGRKGTAPKRKAARIESDDDLDVDSWGPLSLLTLAETASRQAQEMQEADEAAAAAQQEQNGGATAAADHEATDPLDEFVAERRQVLAKPAVPEPPPPKPAVKNVKRPEPKVSRADVDAVHRQLQLQAAAAEQRIAMELHRRGKRPFAAATASAAAAPAAAAAAKGPPALQPPARLGSLSRAGTSEPVLGIPYTPQLCSSSTAPRSTPNPGHPVQQGSFLTAGRGRNMSSTGLPTSSGVHGPTNSTSAFAAQRAAAAGSIRQSHPVAAPTGTLTAPVHTKVQDLSMLKQASPTAAADTAVAGAPHPSESAPDSPAGTADQHEAVGTGGQAATNGNASSEANAVEQDDAGADSRSDRDAPAKKSDADMEIDGLLTHWTPVRTSFRTRFTHACLTSLGQVSRRIVWNVQCHDCYFGC